jgi:hypothetical protein
MNETADNVTQILGPNKKAKKPVLPSQSRIIFTEPEP